jgi:hypothetical protein
VNGLISATKQLGEKGFARVIAIIRPNQDGI